MTRGKEIRFTQDILCDIASGRFLELRLKTAKRSEKASFLISEDRLAEVHRTANRSIIIDRIFAGLLLMALSGFALVVAWACLVALGVIHE